MTVSHLTSILQMTGKVLIFACVCLRLLQSPTARRCGWWCLWCACRWWLSPSSSLSSSAPWDTIAACRAPRVRDAVTSSARQSSHRHCSIHNFLTNLSLHHLCKLSGGRFEECVYAKHPTFFDCTWVKTIIPHPRCGLFIFNKANAEGAVVVDFDIFTVLVSSSFILFTVCSSVLLHSYNYLEMP